MTNGEFLKRTFNLSDEDIDIGYDGVYVYNLDISILTFTLKWWNKEYAGTRLESSEQDQWIPVSTPPRFSDDVWITITDGIETKVKEGYYNPLTYTWNFDGWGFYRPIAWMPIIKPEPYKEDKNE